MRRIEIAALVFALLMPVASAHAQGVSISVDRARRIALASVPGNQGVKSEKLRTEDGLRVYEFDIRTAGPGHREVRVDARTGAIVQNKHEEGVINETARKTAHETEKVAQKVAHEADKIFGKDEIPRMNLRISEARARRIALRSTGATMVKDVDLKREHDEVLWDVKVEGPGKGHGEVRIDANTGAIVKNSYHR